MGSLNDVNETLSLYSNSDDVEYDDVTEMKTSSIFLLTFALPYLLGFYFIWFLCIGLYCVRNTRTHVQENNFAHEVFHLDGINHPESADTFTA